MAGRERASLAATRGLLIPITGQVVPGKPQNGDCARAPLPKGCLSKHCARVWGEGALGSTPRGAACPIPTHVRSKSAEGRERAQLPHLFGGMNIPQGRAQVPRRLGNPPAMEEGAGGVSPLTPAANLLLSCGNCQCSHCRENQITRCRDKGAPRRGPRGSWLSQGCRGERDGKYKGSSWGLGDFCRLQSGILLVGEIKRTWE